MIFKAKWNWRTKKEVIDQLMHTADLIEQGYPGGYGWTLTGDELSPANTEMEEEKLEGEQMV